jgi:hypothetical protein
VVTGSLEEERRGQARGTASRDRDVQYAFRHLSPEAELSSGRWSHPARSINIHMA